MTISEPTVFIVDDEELLRNMVRRVAQSADVPCELFSCAEDFLASCPEPRPGCLLLDVDMPGMSGLELQQELRRRELHLPVVLVTGHDDVPTVLAAMKAQALDVVQKPFDNGHLRNVMLRALAVDAERRQWQELRFHARRRAQLLNDREREVMTLVVEGLANKQIAHRLDLSIKTVEAYRSSVMKKTNVDSLPELVKLAVVLEDVPAGIGG